MSKSWDFQPPYEDANIETLIGTRSPVFSAYVLSSLQSIETQIFSNDTNIYLSITKEMISVSNGEQNTGTIWVH